MGNNHSPNSSQLSTIITKDWKQISINQSHHIYQHCITKDRCQHLILFNLQEKQLQIYQQRKSYSYVHNPAIYYFKKIRDPNNSKFISQGWTFDIQIVVENVPFKLSQYKDHLEPGFWNKRLQQVFLGFQYLYHKYGAFQIEPNMIGWTNNRNIKTWFNQDFSNNSFRKHGFSQKTMIDDLKEIFCFVFENQNLEKINSFQKALKYVKQHFIFEIQRNRSSLLSLPQQFLTGRKVHSIQQIQKYNQYKQKFSQKLNFQKQNNIFLEENAHLSSIQYRRSAIEANHYPINCISKNINYDHTLRKNFSFVNQTYKDINIWKDQAILSKNLNHSFENRQNSKNIYIAEDKNKYAANILFTQGYLHQSKKHTLSNLKKYCNPNLKNYNFQKQISNVRINKDNSNPKNAKLKKSNFPAFLQANKNKQPKKQSNAYIDGNLQHQQNFRKTMESVNSMQNKQISSTAYNSQIMSSFNSKRQEPIRKQLFYSLKDKQNKLTNSCKIKLNLIQKNVNSSIQKNLHKSNKNNNFYLKKNNLSNELINKTCQQKQQSLISNYIRSSYDRSQGSFEFSSLKSNNKFQIKGFHKINKNTFLFKKSKLNNLENKIKQYDNLIESSYGKSNQIFMDVVKQVSESTKRISQKQFHEQNILSRQSIKAQQRQKRVRFEITQKIDKDIEKSIKQMKKNSSLKLLGENEDKVLQSQQIQNDFDALFDGQEEEHVQSSQVSFDDLRCQLVDILQDENI